MGLIKEILATCDDLTYHYISSKKPKFLKMLSFNRSMKKIDKILDKLSNSDITGLTLEFAEVLLENHPPFGRYEHCASVRLINERYSASFEYDILKTNKDKYHIVADVYQVSSMWYQEHDLDDPSIVQFHIYHNGIRAVSFSVNIQGISPKILDDPNRIEAVSAEARVEFVNIIRYDILQFFNDYQRDCRAKVKINGQ